MHASTIFRTVLTKNIPIIHKAIIEYSIPILNGSGFADSALRFASLKSQPAKKYLNLFITQS